VFVVGTLLHHNSFKEDEVDDKTKFSVTLGGGKFVRKDNHLSTSPPHTSSQNPSPAFDHVHFTEYIKKLQAVSKSHPRLHTGWRQLAVHDDDAYFNCAFPLDSTPQSISSLTFSAKVFQYIKVRPPPPLPRSSFTSLRT